KARRGSIIGRSGTHGPYVSRPRLLDLRHRFAVSRRTNVYPVASVLHTDSTLRHSRIHGLHRTYLYVPVLGLYGRLLCRDRFLFLLYDAPGLRSRSASGSPLPPPSNNEAGISSGLRLLTKVAGQQSFFVEIRR